MSCFSTRIKNNNNAFAELFLWIKKVLKQKQINEKNTHHRK